MDDSNTTLVAEIVSAYVSNNSVAVADLSRIIGDVHAAVQRLSTNEPFAAPPEVKPVPAVPVKKSVTPDFIYCLDDEVTMAEMQKRTITAKQYPFSIRERVEEGAYLHNNEIIINIHNNQLSMTIEELALQGKHNTYNSMAAGIAARLLEVRKETVRESLADVQNVEHRMEFVARINNIDFVNDSKATNVNSTWYALESMNTPVVWIVGGVDKGNDYSALVELVKSKVKAIVILGKDNAKIIKAFGGKIDTIVEAATAQEAVSLSYRLASKGDTVLLSPACASFDLFENYEDRGRQFKTAVRSL